ncbi:MAG: hypothetical protein AAF380_01365 [Bacteroidota bacterium]
MLIFQGNKWYFRKEIKKFSRFFPTTIILRPKQVGKTTLTKKTIHLLNKECIHLDLEKSALLKILTPP